jgi:hypothetical protein
MKIRIASLLRFGRASITGAPVRIASRHQSSSERDSLLGSHLYPAPLVPALIRETRNFCFRIRELSRTQPHRRGVQLDLRHQTTWSLELSCQAQDVSTQDMHKLFSDFPALTTLDAQTFLQGWIRGAEWGLNSGNSRPLS